MHMWDYSILSNLQLKMHALFVLTWQEVQIYVPRLHSFVLYSVNDGEFLILLRYRMGLVNYGFLNLDSMLKDNFCLLCTYTWC